MHIKSIKYRLKAGILPYVLVVSLIITIVCLIMILFTYYNSLFWSNKVISDKLKMNVESGIEYALACDLDSFEYEFPYYIDLYGETNDSIEILINKWGLIDLLEVTAFKDTIFKKNACLVGASSNKIEKAALYVSNASSLPVTLVGKTSIVGDVYLPSGGVKSGSLNKKTYEGSNLISGTKMQSKNELPKIRTKNITIINKYFQLLNKDVKSNKNQEPYIKQGFKQAEYLWISNEVIELKDTLLGKVIVVSSEKVVINKSSVIKNIIVVAPVIEVKSGFKGDFQGFALNEILVREGACLEYPSLLFVDNTLEGRISIEKNVEVRGTLLMLNIDKKTENENGTIIIGENSLIVGQVVSEGYINLRGTIFGNMVCRSSWYENNVNTYINYFVDCTIKRNNLPSSFLFIHLFDSEGRKNEVIRDLNLFE